MHGDGRLLLLYLPEEEAQCQDGQRNSPLQPLQPRLGLRLLIHGGSAKVIHGQCKMIDEVEEVAKIQVPEYSGEDGCDGMKAKGYIRKIDDWQRVTRLPKPKQALVLYNNLSGRAWRDAEELELSALDSEVGAEIFMDWIKARYMDREITKVGRYMSDFFNVLKRGSNQDVRDFNQEFGRQISRLREVPPDVCLAWWYVATELNLLSSVGNAYLQKLQDAPIIQDRMNRRLWERRHDGDRKSEDRIRNGVIRH